MKKTILWTALSLFFICTFAQNEWLTIHPYPTLSNLIDAHFVSDSEGWVVGTEGSILYTDDGGNSWETQLSNPNESLWSVFFIDDQEGWACGWSEIYHTEDAGENWELQDAPYFMGDLMDVFFINHDTGWIVGSYKIVLKTTDGGENWIKIQNSLIGAKCSRRVTFFDHLHGCAVGENWNNFDEGYAMITADGGLTWTETTPSNCDFLTDVEYYNSMCIWACGWDGSLFRSLDGGQSWYSEYFGSDCFDAIHFFDKDRGILLEGSNVHLSFDGGDSWDSCVSIEENFHHYSTMMSWDDNKVVAVGSDGIISRTMDGGSNWEQLHQGARVYFGEIGFFDTFNGYGIGSIGGHPDLLRTYDGGYTWEYDSLISHGPFSNLFMNGQMAYLLNHDSSLLMKTLDGGLSWEMKSIPESISYYSDLQFVDENNGYICGGDGAFIKTEDGGSSWIDISLNNTMQLRNIFFIDENNGWMIDYFGKSILHTTDGGYNWSSSQLGGSIIYQPESIFFLNETDGYVNTDDGLLYKTYDGGSTWEVIYGFYSGWNSSIYFTTETEGWYITGMVFHTYDG